MVFVPMRHQSLAIDDMGHLAVFVRVVESGSFAAAARSLGTTPSAASKRVAETPDDLLRHECIRYTLVPAGNEWRFTDRRGPRAVPVSGRIASDHGGSIREAALQGLGIAWLPRFMVEEDLRGGRLRAGARRCTTGGR